jgi:thiocyanate hydrolase gamma subunit
MASSDETRETAHDDLHRHAPQVDEITDFEVLEIAVRELAIEKGVFTAEDHRRFTEFVEQLDPTRGARLVAKAWLDPEFRRLALEDAIAASREVGVDWLQPTGFGTPSDFTALTVLEDTPKLHHVVVCTLCSCYPRPILGNSPEWYRTPNYRRRIVRWPRQVLSEFGLQLPEDVEVRVEDSNQKHRFMVLPVRPAGTEGWSEDQLTEIVTRDCLIGVALPKPGVTKNAIRSIQPATRPAANY